MVFFTCNACGQAVKKNQVEKHYKLQCRNCEVLSCMDCGKDFHGDEYMTHTKCVSEDQKYGGKDYKPKSNANKGEAKQEEWILQIQNRIDSTKVRPALAQLLKQLITFTNIPRNGKKFQKFLENSLKVYNKALIQEAWEIFSNTKEQKSKSSNNENGTTEPMSEAVDKMDSKNKRSNDDMSINCTNNSAGIMNKEPTTKKHKKEKKHKTMNNHVEQENEKLNKECSNGSAKISSESAVEETQKKKSKKSKKNKSQDIEIAQEERQTSNISMESEMENSSIISNDDVGNGKKKFKWKKVIKAVLKSSSDNEISLKKLQKKVLAEYYAAGGEPKPISENELRAMFRKKVTSNPKFKVHKERVKLVS